MARVYQLRPAAPAATPAAIEHQRGQLAEARRLTRYAQQREAQELAAFLALGGEDEGDSLTKAQAILDNEIERRRAGKAPWSRDEADLTMTVDGPEVG